MVLKQGTCAAGQPYVMPRRRGDHVTCEAIKAMYKQRDSVGPFPGAQNIGGGLGEQLTRCAAATLRVSTLREPGCTVMTGHDASEPASLDWTASEW